MWAVGLLFKLVEAAGEFKALKQETHHFCLHQLGAFVRVCKRLSTSGCKAAEGDFGALHEEVDKLEEGEEFADIPWLCQIVGWGVLLFALRCTCLLVHGRQHLHSGLFKGTFRRVASVQVQLEGDPLIDQGRAHVVLLEELKEALLCGLPSFLRRHPAVAPHRSCLMWEVDVVDRVQRCSYIS